MAAKKQKLARQTKKGFGTKPLEQELAMLQSLVAKEKLLEARELAKELNTAYPPNLDVATELINIGFEIEDYATYVEGCEVYLSLKPDDGDISYALAGAYTKLMQPLLALEAFRTAINRFPDHENAKSAKETVKKLESKLDELLESGGISGEDGYNIAIAHERAQLYLEQRNYAQAKAAESEVLKLKPDFAPAFNNLSLIAFLEGNLPEAIHISEQVLETQPDNIHALANLIRYRCLNGELTATQPLVEKLKASTSKAADSWSKKAEALTYVGDDGGIIDLFNQYQADRDRNDESSGLFYHLVAVALTRQDRLPEARNLWKQALESPSSKDLAQANLNDLKKPVGMRHAPWAFTVGQWITEATINELKQTLASNSKLKDEQKEAKVIEKFLRDRPYLLSIFPILLHRGDPQGREFAFRTALFVETPQMYEIFKEFALSQDGPDEMRHRAAMKLYEVGVFSSEPVRMWFGGKWQDINLIAYEFYSESPFKHTHQVQDLLTNAVRLMKTDDTANLRIAEELLKQALQLEDTPDLHNNLAYIYNQTDREQEAQNLLREIMERFPDYVMGQVGVARHHIGKKQLDQAEIILKKLMQHKRFHIDDFANFCNAYIEFYLAKNEREGAKSWLQMWENVYPDHPAIKPWQRKLKGGLLERITGKR